jgi:hypothetical protein
MRYSLNQPKRAPFLNATSPFKGFFQSKQQPSESRRNSLANLATQRCAGFISTKSRRS